MSKLLIVGIGPGKEECITLQGDNALKQSDVIVGYHVYTELVKARYPEKRYYTTPMTKEAERCRKALDLAVEGFTVSMVCSGDSGIYGMAALIYELRGESQLPEIKVIPGLTAACSGGAVLGAPLTHDFAVISLSDRLTSWEVIERRLTLAAQADLTIVLYNPVSRGRPHHLQRACDILMQSLPENRICGVVRNIGRDGEESYILSLKELRNFPADMFCTVFVGNGQTKLIGDKMITPRGYHHE